MRSGPTLPHRSRPRAPRTGWADRVTGPVARVEPDPARVDPEGMSTPEDAPAAPDPDRVPSGASGAVPVHLGVPTTPRRSGAEAPPGTPPWLLPPPRPTVSALRWDNRGARRRRSSTTFGLPGRVVLTVLVVGFLAWLAVTNPLMSPMALPVVAWALKDVWTSVPVIAPEPPVRPQPQARPTGQSGVPE